MIELSAAQSLGRLLDNLGNGNIALVRLGIDEIERVAPEPNVKLMVAARRLAVTATDAGIDLLRTFRRRRCGGRKAVASGDGGDGLLRQRIGDSRDGQQVSALKWLGHAAASWFAVGSLCGLSIASIASVSRIASALALSIPATSCGGKWSMVVAKLNTAAKAER